MNKNLDEALKIVSLIGDIANTLNHMKVKHSFSSSIYKDYTEDWSNIRLEIETELSANHRFIVATVVEVAFAAAVKLSPRVKTLFTATAARLAASKLSSTSFNARTCHPGGSCENTASTAV